MSNHGTTQFLAGAIEGFYGQPWTQEDRLQLFGWMAEWGLNAYLYAPKADLRQRQTWRELYPNAEAAQLKELVESCRQRSLHFIYALSPGLDIRYRDASELEQVKKKFEQMLSLGCENFSLLFDDIPERMDAGDLEQFGSIASAQCHVANAIFQWLRERTANARLLFCPTAYHGRAVEQGFCGEGYLPTIGRELLPEIDVFWTGPEIISREITVSHIREVRAMLRRKPLIWDNLHANDYDGRRFFCGPYAGRPSELRNEVSGLLSNPNNEFSLNYVPLRTLAGFVNSNGSWDTRKAYLSAMRAWLTGFVTCNQPIHFDDLVFFGDCYYLPHEDGCEAQAFYQDIEELVTSDSGRHPGKVADFRKRVARLREFCLRAADLTDRKLFYALSRRTWEMGEELNLLERYLESNIGKDPQDAPFRSDSHLPRVYRGGMVARLQQLLVQQPDGTFIPALRREAKRNNQEPAHLAPIT